MKNIINFVFTNFLWYKIYFLTCLINLLTFPKQANFIVVNHRYKYVIQISKLTHHIKDEIELQSIMHSSLCEFLTYISEDLRVSLAQYV